MDDISVGWKSPDRCTAVKVLRWLASDVIMDRGGNSDQTWRFQPPVIYKEIREEYVYCAGYALAKVIVDDRLSANSSIGRERDTAW